MPAETPIIYRRQAADGICSMAGRARPKFWAGGWWRRNRKCIPAFWNAEACRPEINEWVCGGLPRPKTMLFAEIPTLCIIRRLSALP